MSGKMKIMFYTLNNGKLLLSNSNVICSKSIGRNISTTTGNRMRFVQFKLKKGGPQHLGAQISPGADIFDLSAVDTTIPNSLVKLLQQGNGAVEKAKRVIASGKSVVSMKEVDILPPIIKPDKVVCVGLNYTGHCKEQNISPPKDPMFFNKFPSTIIGPNDNIRLPPVTNALDWEVELAVIIGKTAKEIKQEQAKEYIFGYTVAQDISARDWQKLKNNGQFLLGKSMDNFCPLGPAVVSNYTVDPDNLAIKSWVNGVLKQDGNTSELVFKIDYLISYLSQLFTLYPGDVILTGTPAGVGMHRKPPEYLKKGDVLESEIEGIGRLRNVIV